MKTDSNLELSPLMVKAKSLLKKHRIFLSQRAGLLTRDSAWNSGLSAEWHGKKRYGNRVSHQVSITFTHREGSAAVEVFDLHDEVTILVCPCL